MGLDDRDYMRERSRRTFDRLVKDKDRPFTPPPTSPSLLSMILFWIGIALALYQVYGWWERHKLQRPPEHIGRMQAAEAPTLANERQAVVPSPTPVRPSELIRGDDALPQATEVPRQETGGTIYLCRDYSGGTFWASDHCNRHNGLIETMVSVPPGMPFQQQVAIAEQRRQTLASPTSVYTAATPAAAPVPNKLLCESLDTRVNELDAMARQPQSPGMQDWIRQERRKSRDEQYRLHC